MKNRIVSAVLAILLLCSGCTTTTEPADSRIKIGVSLYQADDVFVASMKDVIIKAARAQEIKDNVKITLYIMDATGQQSLQNEQVDQFIAKGYNAMCINMVDRTAASVIVDKAEAADIPVVFFNREPVSEDLDKWDKACYVGANADQSGMIQGNLIADEYFLNHDQMDRNGDGTLQYVMLEGELGHQDALLRTEHSIKALTNRGIRVEKLANGAALWRRALAKEKMYGWLESFGGAIEVVISNNDEMAIGALAALKEYNVATGAGLSPYILGIDGIADSITAVKNRELFATVLNDEQAQGRAVFELAYNMGVNGTAVTSVPGFDGKKLLTNYAAVDFDNVYELRER